MSSFRRCIVIVLLAGSVATTGCVYRREAEYHRGRGEWIEHREGGRHEERKEYERHEDHGDHENHDGEHM